MGCCRFHIPGMTDCGCGGSCSCSSGSGESFGPESQTPWKLETTGRELWTGGGEIPGFSPAGGSGDAPWNGPVGGYSQGYWNGPPGSGLVDTGLLLSGKHEFESGEADAGSTSAFVIPGLPSEFQ